MSIITPITGGAGVVPLGALARGHHTVRSRALAGEAGEFAGGWAETDLYLPEWVAPDATLDLDFLGWQAYAEPAGLGRGGVISTPDAALTVSRPSARSRVGPSGLIETVGSGLIARDFTVAGVARALLIEPQTTNLLNYSSERDNAYWTKGAASVSADAATGPDGLSSADKLVENTATDAFHFISRTLTKAAAATTYTYTEYVKAAGRTYVGLSCFSGSNGVGATANLGAGTIGAAGAYGSGWVAGAASIEDAGNGYYRVRMTFTTSTETSVSVQLSLRTASTNVYTGDGTSGVYIWGAQFEAIGVPTSYMPAGASSAVRYADGVSLALGSWFNPLAGTLLVESVIPYDTGATMHYAEIGDGTANNRILLYTATGSPATGGAIITGGAQQFGGAGVSAGANYVFGAVRKAAISWAVNSAQLCVDGTLSALDTSIAVPTATTLRLGANNNAPSLGGWLRRVTYWPEARSGAQMQADQA